VWAGPAQASVPDNWGFRVCEHPVWCARREPSGRVAGRRDSWCTPRRARPGEVFRQVPADRLQRRGGARDRGHRHRGVGCQAEHWGPRPERNENRRGAVLQGPGRGTGVPRRSWLRSAKARPRSSRPAAGLRVTFHFEPGRGRDRHQPSTRPARGEHGDAGADRGVDGCGCLASGLPSPPGMWQVTAVNPAVCRQVRAAAMDPPWASGQSFMVRCYDATTQPAVHWLDG